MKEALNYFDVSSAHKFELKTITFFEMNVPLRREWLTSTLLSGFQKAFDKAKALKDGKIVPAPGVDKEFDEAQKRVADVKASLEEHLQEQIAHFGTSKVRDSIASKVQRE